MKKKIWLVLVILVVLGGWLRLWQLANYPVSLSIDELADGYNAYSISKTARDEHGQLLPLAFRSVGDYKPPVLIYLMTPVISLLGLNEFSVRLTIAFVGTLTILLVFLMVKELIKNELIALLTSFSLAISPWHIHFSRATFDAILALFLMIAGVWLWLRAMRLKGKLLWLSAICFVLAMYGYHAERVVVPLLVLALVVIFRQRLWQYRQMTMIALIVGLILILPLLFLMIGPEGLTRPGREFISRDHLIAGEINFFAGSGTVFSSRPLVLFNFWLKRYFDYWDLDFLFLKGSRFTWPGFPNVGLFHLIEIVPFLLGIWLVFFDRRLLRGKSKQILVVWLLVGILPASLAITSQHPQRSLTAIPAPHILIGLGSFWLINYLRKKNLLQKLVVSLFALVLIVFSLGYYADIYFLHFPVHFSEFWGYGIKELSLYAWQHKDEYQEIVIDPRYGSAGPDNVTTPYLYLLFYGQYDPYRFQNSPRRRVKTEDSVDFENFTFREIYWPEDRNKKNTLFIGSPWSLPLDEIRPEQILKEIKFKNGLTAFLIVKT